MANPQPDKFTRLSNELYEAIMTTDFSKRQRNILDLVIRMSYGCGKKFAILRPSDFELVGVRKGHVKQELNYLAQSKVLIVDGERVQLNKNYDQWRVSLVTCFNQDKFKELIKRNISAPQVTEMVTEVTEMVTDIEDELPKQELSSYQNGNQPVTEMVTDIASQPYSDKASSDPKDILKKNKDINNDNNQFDDQAFWNALKEEIETGVEKIPLTEEQKLKKEIEDYYQTRRGEYGFPATQRDLGFIDQAIKEGFTREEMIAGINEAFLTAESIDSFRYCLKVMRTQRRERERAAKQRVVPFKRSEKREKPLPEALRMQREYENQPKQQQPSTPEQQADMEAKQAEIRAKLALMNERFRQRENTP